MFIAAFRLCVICLCIVFDIGSCARVVLVFDERFVFDCVCVFAPRSLYFLIVFTLVFVCSIGNTVGWAVPRWFVCYGHLSFYS